MATRVEVRDSAIVSELSTHDIPLDVREASVQDFYRALPPAAILYIEDWVLAPLAAISCFFFLSFTRSDFFLRSDPNAASRYGLRSREPGIGSRKAATGLPVGRPFRCRPATSRGRFIQLARRCCALVPCRR